MIRTRFCSLHIAASVTTGLTLAFINVVQAQEAVPPAPPPAVEPAPPAAEPPPAAILVPVQEVPPSVTAPAAPVAEEKPATTEIEEDEEDKPWTDGITIGAFVDAYGALRSDNNEARLPESSSIGGPAGPLHEAYVQASGFALAFAGADLAYSGEKFGATISLRFGPGVNRFYAADMGAFGIDNITQGFLTYKPTESLTFDLGQFYTIYGAEVAESWKNVNYSRGALYYAMQPFWHTGLRVNYKLNDVLAFNALLVNGVNSAFEGNKSPSVGIQALLTPSDMLLLAVGYLGALNPRDGDEETAATKNFENFIDVVGTLTAGNFKLVANFDYNLYRQQGIDDSENWWGISVAPRIGIVDWFGVGARVEYVADSANSQLGMSGITGKTSLTTLTGTLDFTPFPQLILRPEIRYELASDNDYLDRDNAPTDKFWSLHLGAVVTSMP